MKESFEFSDTLGYEIVKKCPKCQSQMFGNKRGDEWCSECEYSNNQELSDFKKDLAGKERVV